MSHLQIITHTLTSVLVFVIMFGAYAMTDGVLAWTLAFQAVLYGSIAIAAFLNLMLLALFHAMDKLK